MSKNKKNWPEWVKNYKSKWPEVREKLKNKESPRMYNTAVTQLLGALLLGDPKYLIEHKPETPWLVVPKRFYIGYVTDENGKDKFWVANENANAVRMCGYNPEKVVKYITRTYKEEEGKKKYFCELVKLADEENTYAIDCPMYVIWSCLYDLVVKNARKRMAKRSTKRSSRKK